MFPGIHDFAWDAGHIIFLGIFYSVLVVVAATMLIAVRRAFQSFRARRADALRWHADFADLPATARRCRHELAGEIASRQCPNGFDCRQCEEHPRFVAARTTPLQLGEPRVAGFELPADRLYHRGHTWVRQEEDGTMTVGLDDLGSHLLGNPDALQMPPVGTFLETNGSGWEARKNGVPVRLLAPIDGEVIAVGSPQHGWYLKIRPDGEVDTRHLLTAAEARPWLLREVERLQMAMATDGVGAALADGGVPIDDLSVAIPTDRMDDVYGMLFMHP